MGERGSGVDRLAPAAARVRALGHRHLRVTDIGGYATGGHVPNSDHYTGHALDIMLTPTSPAATALGWRIAGYLQAHARTLGITYLIWQARIWSVQRAGEGWRPYRPPSGATSPTLLHLDHIHVSVS